MSCDAVAVRPDDSRVPRKPPRLNFAGVCMWCGEPGCRSRRCMRLHARSRWMVCDDCGGESFCLCTCVFGVVEASPAGVAEPEAVPAAASSSGGSP
jgi:hypothetical protein